MAAGDFSAATMLRIQKNLSEMFAQPNVTTFGQTHQPAITARALLENQTATADERLEGGNCVGVKAYFLNASGIGSVSTPTDCVTPGGVEIEAGSKNYDTEILAQSAGTVREGRCDNEISFIEESTTVINAILSQLRKQINVKVIQRLSANAQANIYTGIPSTWDYTTNTPRIDIPKADFKWDMLGEFGSLFAGNNFNEVIMLSGKNFYNDFWKAGFSKEGFCDCGAAAAGAYSSLKMFFDNRDLDATMTRPTTFAVDMNSYIFWNSILKMHTAIPTQATEDKWTWYVADPILSYNQNGRLTPVLHMIEMERKCASRNSLTGLINSYKYYGRTIGGFGFVPTGPNGEKGVLEMAAV